MTKENHPRETKRAIVTDDATTTPAYGSQQYWEDRYCKKCKVEDTNQNKDDPDQFHSWYFTYQDLRPLLLPLILGDKDSELILESSGIDNEDEQQEQEDQDAHSDVVEHADSDDDDCEEPRVGLAENGPISILEVGCGDVPLGDALANEINEFQAHTVKSATHTPSRTILERVLCTDYSPTCISTLTKAMLNGKTNEGSGPPVLEFEVTDARKMKYPDETFHLVLEKGTLDAMISDQDDGVENCIAIVTECARVLKLGGCIFLVSHINVRTTDGQEWLEDVLVTGLQAGGGSNTRWEIEIHGNDEGDDEEESPPALAPTSSPGPAVYIIRKKQRSDGSNVTLQEETDDLQSTDISLHFFTY